jgi:methylated-DNA-protein-cysteine methyltransferase related protein
MFFKAKNESLFIMEISLNEKNKDFFESVHEVVCLIPKGRVTSYGAIANYLGAKKGSRMVGWAMKAAHAKMHIPAHRVVNRNGDLTGKHNFNSPNEMKDSLESEGILVVDDRVQNFESHFWDPTIEILD